MGGGDETNATSNETSSTGPWKHAMPLLSKTLGIYGNLDPSVTPGQTDSINRMRTTLGGLPDMSSVFTGAINKLGSFDTSGNVGMWNDAYKNLQGNLGDVAAGKYLDPYSTPGMTGWLDTLTNDITKSVKGVYAGSGRSPSGAGSFSERLGRGLSEGLSPVVANQANRNRADQMAAAQALFGAGGQTAQGTAALAGMPLQYQTQAAQLAGQLPGWLTAKDQALMGLEDKAAQLPFQNAAMLLNPALQFGAMGQDGTKTGLQNKSQDQSMFSNILGGVMGASALGKMGGLGGLLGGIGSGLGSLGSGLGGLLGGGAAAGTAGSLFSALPFAFLSDERAKEDIEPVGMLDDGQTVYSYRYKGDPRPQIGLLAQEVAEHVPDAVVEFPGGLLGVDYGKATRHARALRGVLDLQEAA